MKSTAGKRDYFYRRRLGCTDRRARRRPVLLQNKADAQGRSVQAPMFEVDPLWPKPLPNHWLLGWTIGVWVDEQDHIWIIHRGAGGLHNNERGARTRSAHRRVLPTAPPVLEFDQAGNLLRRGRSGTGLRVAAVESWIPVDYKGNVWIGGNGQKDAQILKFTRDGKFLMQVGHTGKNAGSNDPENFWRVAKILVDPKTNEAYIADGYGNKRVAVIDADTGKMKRYWGAYGNKPDDTDLGKYNPKAPPAQQFRSPVHCVEPRTTVWSTSATARTTVCRCSRRTASSSRKRSSRRRRWRRVRCGTWRFRRTRSRNTSTSPTAKSKGAHHPASDAGGADELRRRRSPARPVLRRAQHRDRFERQPLHHRNLRRKARAEVRLQRHGTVAAGSQGVCGRNKSGACRIPELMPVQKHSGLTKN